MSSPSRSFFPGAEGAPLQSASSSDDSYQPSTWIVDKYVRLSHLMTQINSQFYSIKKMTEFTLEEFESLLFDNAGSHAFKGQLERADVDLLKSLDDNSIDVIEFKQDFEDHMVQSCNDHTLIDQLLKSGAFFELDNTISADTPVLLRGDLIGGQKYLIPVQLSTVILQGDTVTVDTPYGEKEFEVFSLPAHLNLIRPQFRWAYNKIHHEQLTESERRDSALHRYRTLLNDILVENNAGSLTSDKLRGAMVYLSYDHFILENNKLMLPDGGDIAANISWLKSVIEYKQFQYQEGQGRESVEPLTLQLELNEAHQELEQELRQCVSEASDQALNHAIISVSALVNGHLQQSMPTPLYFHRENIYRDIISIKIEALKTLIGEARNPLLLEIHVANTELIKKASKKEKNSRNNSYFHAYAWEVFHDIATTDAHLFEGIDIDKFLFSDVIYSYRDDQQRTKEDTVSVIDYLCQKVIPHPITSRQNISLAWPQEFDYLRACSLSTFLNEEAENLLRSQTEAQLLKDVEKARAKVSSAIVTPKTYFQHKLDQLLGQYPSHPAIKLTDTVSYSNRVTMLDMNLQAGANYDNPPENLIFSVADILAGRVREWESTHISYNTPEFSNLGAMSSDLLNALKNEDIQPQYTESLRLLLANQTVKKDFYSYLRAALKFHGSVRTGSFSIEHAPLLLVSHDDENGPRIPISSPISHGPIKVVSLLTNSKVIFPSVDDFRQQIRQSEKLRKWVSLHFPAGFAGEYDNLLISEHKTDYSYLYENTINKYADDMDVWVRSASEAGALKAFEIIEMLSPVLVLPAFAMTPVTGFVYGAALAATPHLGRAAISDTIEERDSHLLSSAKAVALEAVFQLGFRAAAKAAGRVFRPTNVTPKLTQDAFARRFKIDGVSREFHGRVKFGKFEVSIDNGLTWNKAGKGAEFAWRMQNAGPGAKKLPLSTDMPPAIPERPPVVPARPAHTLPGEAPVVPARPAHTLPGEAPVVPARPAHTLPGEAPVVPVRPVHTLPGEAPVVPARPAHTLPGEAPVVPQRPGNTLPDGATANTFSPLEIPPKQDFRFSNKQPNTFADEVSRAKKMARGPFEDKESGFAELINDEVDFKWVLKQDRKIVIGLELSHPVLGGGEDVISAGHARKIGNGKIWISNQTGHYQANYESIKQSVESWNKLGYEPNVNTHSNWKDNGYTNLFA
ncbi:hypothetical protein SKA34_01207 [Photobacterium sp. SKA34]|uniref:hypothetical protein n=1 Tax=Photobacterium sp. SKA34 TaxID=121723 RepID=UPI00006AFFF7|nr:hypothetical protein [Photobacterium sp. SKA34]EAR53774.1 hypothetical protein SKA34_01207 [Photobacterium sp. SKA34]